MIHAFMHPVESSSAQILLATDPSGITKASPGIGARLSRVGPSKETESRALQKAEPGTRVLLRGWLGRQPTSSTNFRVEDGATLHVEKPLIPSQVLPKAS